MKNHTLGRSYCLYALLTNSSLKFEKIAGLMPHFGLGMQRRKAFQNGLQHVRSWFYLENKKENKIT